jgi:hypothetical protein
MKSAILFFTVILMAGNIGGLLAYGGDVHVWWYGADMGASIASIIILVLTAMRVFDKEQP